MSNRITKIGRLAKTLGTGRTVSTRQAIKQFGFASTNSVTRAIATLRERGAIIETVETRNGTGYVSA